jgi:putative sporulation protein YyaC
MAGGKRLRDAWKGLLPLPWAQTGEQRVHMDAPEAVTHLADALFQFGAGHLTQGAEIVLLCIGTDRSIGDSLGPLIGTELALDAIPGLTVMGTLDHPVHASNLADTLTWIETGYQRPFVIAVDACLGRVESIGMLTVGKGSLKPGAGVNKALPSVGDIHMTGVVNVGGFMEYFVLQNTRLSLVMRMAKVAAAGIRRGLLPLTSVRQPK